MCFAERGFPQPEELLKEITFLTDGGADVVASLNMTESVRLYCFAHYLNVYLSS